MCYRLATLYKKRLQLRCFPDNFAKFLRGPFFIEHLRWLILFEHIHLIDLEFLLWIWNIHFVSWASQDIAADKNIFKVKNEDNSTAWIFDRTYHIRDTETIMLTSLLI